ncbi:MAG: Hsp70 family protein [Planctomycetes bacterium]|nr:Hsp70 family protein [Planctomycetota bacterium]
MSTATEFSGLIGIDLGTTYSCVARLSREGIPQTIPNREGELTTPSVLMVEDQMVVVGREAKRSECVYPDRTAICVKRDMGGARYSRSLAGQEYRPEILSAMILKRIKTDVESRFGPVQHAVITVPAYFDDTRRKATQDAGRIAGLNVLDIINEPTAAALAFAFESHRRRNSHFEAFARQAVDSPTTALVYDLGGGTFDVSIVRFAHDRFETLATDGDVRLGGRDWDERLVTYLAEQFRTAHGSDPRDDPQSLAFLYQEAEKVKHALSVRTATRVLVSHDGQRLSLDLTRRQFDDLTADLVLRTETTTELVLDSAGLTWSQIDRVLMVGGMTRVPHIREMIQRISGKEPDCSLPADEVVAQGAALHGGILLARMAKGKGSINDSALGLWVEFESIDVNSHSLGIAVRRPDGGYANSILIPKNTPLPVERSRTYHTSAPNQRQVRVRILEGEAYEAEACVQIGEFVLGGLPADLPERSPIEIVCRYTSDGRISVQGRHPNTGLLAETTLVSQGRLNDAELREEARKIGLLEIV